MQIRNTPTWKALTALPRATLANLYSAMFPGQSPSTVSQACDEIAKSLGQETVDSALRRLGIQSPDHVSSATAAIAERAEKATLDLQKRIDWITNVVQSLEQKGDSRSHGFRAEIDTLTQTIHNAEARSEALRKAECEERLASLARIDSAIRSVSEVKVDQTMVAAAVTEAVAQAFAPFKSAVESAGVQTQVADLAVQSETRTALEVFGLDAYRVSGEAIKFDTVKGQAPAVDHAFVWTVPIIKALSVAASDNGRSTLSNIWAAGEKGTGKTQTAMQFAARTGRPYVRINFQKFTMLEDIAGAVGLSGGNTEFSPGPLLKAWSTPYTVINLDEPSLADPGVLGFLNGLLEPGSRISFGGKVWTRAPGVLVIASDNTFGSGDVTGRYSGTRSQSAAFIDRFGLMVRFDYLPFKHEVDAVVKHTGCKPELAEHVLKAIHIARGKVADGSIIDAPSIRSVIAFVLALPVLPVRQAWDSTIAARQPAESAVTLEAIYAAAIDPKTIESLI